MRYVCLKRSKTIFGFSLGRLGPGGHSDHPDDPPPHHHAEPASLPLPPRPQDLEAPHGQCGGGRSRLVHVPNQH